MTSASSTRVQANHDGMAAGGSNGPSRVPRRTSISSRSTWSARTARGPLSAIAWANDQAADGLVYFTDGFAPAPTVAPRCPMLWVVTADGDPGGLPGRVVRLTS